MISNYFQWVNDFDFPSADEVKIAASFRKIDLFLGRIIEKKISPVELIFDKEEELGDVIPNEKLFLIFSKRLVLFLEANYSKKLFQTFPIKIRVKKTGEFVKDYFLINILNTRDVIDKKKSKLVLGSYDNIITIENLEIVKEDFKDNDFFRLEGFVSLLICSESFVEKLKENNFKGMKFTPITKLFI